VNEGFPMSMGGPSRFELVHSIMNFKLLLILGIMS
jgi:hypothetical protein